MRLFANLGDIAVCAELGLSEAHAGRADNLARTNSAQTDPDGFEDRLLGSADELIGTLEEEFGLDVPEAEILWPRICDRHKTLFGN